MSSTQPQQPDPTAEGTKDHIRKTRPACSVPALPPDPSPELLESSEVTPEGVRAALEAAREAARKNADRSSQVADAATRPPSGMLKTARLRSAKLPRKE